jgi:hypothetical protein
MVGRILVALGFTLALGVFAGPAPLTPTPPEFACGDEESAPPEDSEALQRFACGDEEQGEEPEDSSTLQLG